MKFRYFQDPGHGWIEVPRAMLEGLGIAHKITNYSYQSRDGKLAYLEEDCDAYTLNEALKAQNLKMDLEEIHENVSTIRPLPRFRA